MLTRAVTPAVAGAPVRMTRRWLSRGSSGQGWFKQYEKEGAESFRRSQPPTPFDWSQAGKTSTAFFEIRFCDHEDAWHLVICGELLGASWAGG